MIPATPHSTQLSNSSGYCNLQREATLYEAIYQDISSHSEGRVQVECQTTQTVGFQLRQPSRPHIYGSHQRPPGGDLSNPGFQQQVASGTQQGPPLLPPARHGSGAGGKRGSCYCGADFDDLCGDAEDIEADDNFKYDYSHEGIVDSDVNSHGGQTSYQFSAAASRGSVDRELFKAVMRDDVFTVQDFVKRGVDVKTVRNGARQSLLQVATERGKIHVQTYLEAVATQRRHDPLYQNRPNSCDGI